MEKLGDFLAMGGYSGYVWPAYALTAVVLIGLFAASLRFLHRHQADLATLEAHGIDMPHRAVRAADEA